jgi:glycosyltransferase involved in cell wall biosynthesis
MINKRVSILVGNTPEKAVVYQIAERQREMLSNLYSDVFIGKRDDADISLVHKYGVTVEGRSFKVFFFHFDPYDIRHDIPMLKLEQYLNLFDLIICINRKQQYFCNKRNIQSALIPHGSDYRSGVEIKNRALEKTVVALVCDFYGGNVKGEKYFFELAREMSELLTFKIIGKGWAECENEHVLVVNVDSYAELKGHFDSVDILFIGSRYEAGPASFPDAVNCNKYVMSTPVGMVLDNFIEGESGFYVSFNIADDIASLKNIIERIKLNIIAKYEATYLGWDDQIKEISGVIDENHH